MYAATKAGIAWFTESCAALKDRERIRVNAVLPGIVDTPIIQKTGDGVQPAEWLRPALEMGAMMRPAEIADVVIGLIRDDDVAGECRLALGAPA